MRSRLVSALALLVVGSSVEAQTLNDAVKKLFSFGSGCPEPICLSTDVGVHLAHFNPAAKGTQGDITSFLTEAIGTSAANVPIASATSTGILVQSGEGLPTRRSTSAGPIFAERMQTIGEGRLYIGFNATAFNYSSIRGVPLSGIHANFTHQDTPPLGPLGNPAFENDVIEVNTSMNVRMEAYTTTVTYGLADDLDIGIALPFLNTSVSGSSTAQIMPFGNNDPHFFGTLADPSLTSTSSASSSAAGIGDVAARMKVVIHRSEKWGIAMLGDLRVPTGNVEDFQGTGVLGFRLLGIVSAQFAQFSPHVNLGYYFHEGKTQNDAALVTVGFDQVMADWATLAVDVISQFQTGQSETTLPPDVTLTSFNTNKPNTTRTIVPTNIPNQRDNFVIGSFGVKFILRSGITLVSNALIPIDRGALQPDIAGTLGIDYTF